MYTSFSGLPFDLSTRFSGLPSDLSTRFSGLPFDLSTRFSGLIFDLSTRFFGLPLIWVQDFLAFPLIWIQAFLAFPLICTQAFLAFPLIWVQDFLAFPLIFWIFLWRCHGSHYTVLPMRWKKNDSTMSQVLCATVSRLNIALDCTVSVIVLCKKPMVPRLKVWNFCLQTHVYLKVGTGYILGNSWSRLMHTHTHTQSKNNTSYVYLNSPEEHKFHSTLTKWLMKTTNLQRYTLFFKVLGVQYLHQRCKKANCSRPHSTGYTRHSFHATTLQMIYAH